MHDLLVIDDFNKAHDLNFAFIALPLEPLSQCLDFLKTIQFKQPHTQKIIISEGITLDHLRQIYATGAKNILFVDSKSNLDQAVQMARGRVATPKDPSPTKTQAVTPAQKRKRTTNQQIEALHNSLTVVHAAQSVAEIETLLHSALSETLDLDWVRIFLHTGQHLDEQLNRIRGQALFKFTLEIGAHALGKIVFARKHEKAFTKNEKESLEQISESVTLALDRLAKLDQAETLKLQWDSTFNSISEPLCLTDEKFNIIRTNRAFLQITGLNESRAIGRNCFSAFCGNAAPTPMATSPSAFILQRENGSTAEPNFYEVTTQRIRVHSNSDSILLILFRDITEQKKIEKQIFESSKMAELGTIGSSIAHEINNPLGGMLNFLQLIKMDLPTEDPLLPDILEMEAAGKRCKEIVENLLRFSRRQQAGDAEPVDLNEVIEQALKIIELQTRSLGITVEVRGDKKHQHVLGHFNLLSQALSHVLQNAYDAVAEKLARSPGYNGKILIEMDSKKDQTYLTITDNGIGISPELQNKILNPLFSTKRQNRNQGLGLTLAYQIIDEHKGQLEISSQPNVGTKVKISFPNV